MKKLLLLFAAAGAISLSGCQGDEGPQGPAGPESQVFELNNVNFAYDNAFGYNIYHNFSDFGLSPYDSDVVLVYRLSGTINSQTPIWQSIPRTIYFPNSTDELDYDFDFSPVDFTIYAGGNFDISTEPSYLNGQTFRIVVVPGYFTNRKNVDLNDYNAVIRAFNIDDSHIRHLK